MDDSMLRMQQEAVERVRQMQERARKYVEDDHSSLSKEPYPLHDRQPLPAASHIEPEPVAQNIVRKKGLSFLSGFGEDKEQLFLLMIAILLVKNDAPIELILALLYIAM